MTTTLVIGGARSGKSALALGAVEQLTEIGVLVLAAGTRNAVPCGTRNPTRRIS